MSSALTGARSSPPRCHGARPGDRRQPSRSSERTPARRALSDGPRAHRGPGRAGSTTVDPTGRADGPGLRSNLFASLGRRQRAPRGLPIWGCRCAFDEMVAGRRGRGELGHGGGGRPGWGGVSRVFCLGQPREPRRRIERHRHHHPRRGGRRFLSPCPHDGWQRPRRRGLCGLRPAGHVQQRHEPDDDDRHDKGLGARA